MSSDNKEPKRVSIQSFFRSSFKKKKIDHSSSTIDETSHSQESQPNETSSCSSKTTRRFIWLRFERDFVIDFEKLIDDFADLRKNSRILLK